MLNRIASFIIIASMVLHCAARLGVLSYCYENRYAILFSMGAIQEKPIASCDSNYFTGKVLSQGFEEKTQGITFFSAAQEIILSAPSDSCFLPDYSDGYSEEHYTAYAFHYISNSSLDIFHPPSV